MPEQRLAIEQRVEDCEDAVKRSAYVGKLLIRSWHGVGLKIRVGELVAAAVCPAELRGCHNGDKAVPP